MGVDLMTNAIYDMQVKRIHEYKRQLLNVLGIVHRYAVIAGSTPEQRARMLPRVCVIAGKAAPGYEVAKKIIQLACAVSKAVNNDVRCAGVLQVVFIPNFNVSLAELIIPASDVSQHISTAGMEASGTGNMKFVMNGDSSSEPRMARTSKSRARWARITSSASAPPRMRWRRSGTP